MPRARAQVRHSRPSTMSGHARRVAREGFRMDRLARITAAAAAVAAVTTMMGCQDDETDAGSSNGDDQASADEAGEADGEGSESDPGSDPDAERAEDVDITDVTGATLQTSMGDIELVLFADRAPETVRNFVGLAEGDIATNPETGAEEFYDDTIFHRVIEGFMIQGGDPDGTGTGGPGYTFDDEIDPELAFDEPGVLAMANSGPDTNGSQFFVTTDAASHLDEMHTIFGEVADDESLDVAVEISRLDTGEGDRPETEVVVESVDVHRDSG